ncbi:hypothetical protein AUK04_05125 [Candidatus Roizmanbacteria bacterium CG2_30_33_16]|uniref:Uncharacterized protein n=3 Tax=Candidatus Roizmaniibacteriota TaxID=1752723 RepID=A0A2M7LRE9_9BACT|nr:hypothetical protein [Candidatus Roizmanbacteria bacterium]OIP82180.1 MAG: hypothetical protein AUK04_05125 [Candidatus Roizmanbacteria bacterium CG2_30_33_16]PIX70624.1 MAG: hypothetical protein COZ39_04445 [Candidatus Roizmanbacteria bacterium CG_4_10_14_3_um_filter_33_21]PJB87895.1 MAG: hypothetical protein CO083_04595 [Candidatus Roizmanbacteria bacterium CG_4_9_14_0_8_um_filter_34_12]
MKNKQVTHINHGNFWTGFSLGSILALIALYAFGTKKGRNYLQKIISVAENWEDHLEILVKEVEDVVKNRKQENKGENSDFVGQLLDKIKSKSN